ncbi:MAG: DUF2085 domain-containing protein [bacterium]|nr:DUF2085 domain-containing protein [bacterium]
MSAGDPQPSPRKTALRLNLFTLWLARHWLSAFLVFLGVFIALPIIAPTFMRLGLEGPGRVIYSMYAPFCHQFPFRSFFLYGEQPVYPRASTESGWTPYEVYTESLPEFSDFSPADEFTSLDWILAQKNFVGNAQMGYKMTLCERDIMIYTGLFAGALLYSIPVVRRRLRPVPLWLYVILGLGPIGIDGFSQLLGYPPFNLWPPRETLPIFRVVTGGLFGLMTAWLAVPYVDAGMKDTRREIEMKLRRRGIPLPASR